MCYVTRSYEHGVVDGAIAHQFLHKVNKYALHQNLYALL
jgi:pyruvate/2-oxoglutarate dehydrogenase complex dihydrolipoamide acyltransferase (E2) component